MVDPKALRKRFIAAFAGGLALVWPVLSVLLGLVLGLGLMAGFAEGWSLYESLYFSFVTGLTIGYGDLAPQSLTGRILAVLIGVCGILFTALLAALAVRALNSAHLESKNDE